MKVFTKYLLTLLLLSMASVMNAAEELSPGIIVNADFASLDGWNAVVSESFRDYGNGLIGTYQVRTDFPAATVDDTHLDAEYCLGLECRWGGTFASVTQDIELPAGSYALTYDVENTNGSTRSAAYDNLFKVMVGEVAYVDQSTEWMNGRSSWTNHAIKFTVPEAATVTISLGFGTGDNNFSASNTPALYVSHLALSTIDPDEIEPVEPVVEPEPVEPLFADGTYYLYNVNTGLYLAAGATWGTHAVVNGTGLDYVLVFNDGKYTIDSQVSNGGNSHFLNGEWNDGAAFGWTFNQVGDGIYTISDGTNYLAAAEDGNVTFVADASEAAEWKIIPSDEILAAKIAALANASADNGVDATFLIKGANFNRNDLRNGNWTVSRIGGNVTVGGPGGNLANYGCEFWNNTFEIYQGIANAPEGVYEFSIAGYGTNGTTKIFLNDTEVEFANTTTAANFQSALEAIAAGEYTGNTTGKVNVKDGWMTIGVRRSEQVGADWTVLDNARLTYYGLATIDSYRIAYEEAMAAAKAALENEDYLAVTGEERQIFASTIEAYSNVGDQPESYEIATSELIIATNNFKAAKAAYDALDDAKVQAALCSYEYASAEKKAALEEYAQLVANTSEEALAIAAELTRLCRQAVESHALLEGVEGAVNMTNSIFNPNATDGLSGWMVDTGELGQGSLTVLSNESLTDAEGNAYYSYFDGGGWGYNAWDVSLKQDVALTAGRYMLTVSGRASAEVALMLLVGDSSTGIPAIGAQGGLFGRGWNDASVEFELESDTVVTIGVQGIADGIHNWMSFTRFRLMKFSSEQNNDPVDMTSYILNAGFDEDLTWQTDGSKKATIGTQQLSDRSNAAWAADNTVYATVNPETSKQRSDGRTLEATNGFIGRINGWAIETNQEFPKCEWVYFGSLPYALEGEAIPVADDGSTYITVPAKPEAADGDDNVGFVYMRAGWGGKAIYKQTVELPCAQYRLEYWSINLNPSGTSGKNLSKITCRNDVWLDETGFSSTEWTKHVIEFTPTAEFTMEFGFESEGGSARNPFLCIDGIKLYKIGEADQEVLQRQDLEDIIAQLENQIGIVGEAGLAGVVSELEGAAGVALEAYDNYDLTAEKMEQILKSCRTTLEQSSMAMAQVYSITSMIEKMERVNSTTQYPGKPEFEQSISQMSELLRSGTSEKILTLYKYGKDALLAYYQSQEATADSPADYTYLITHPWFIDEAVEPYADGNGGYAFPNGDSYIEGGSNDVNTDLTMEGWVWWRGGSMSGWDLRTNWVQGRSCFNAWYRSADYSWAAIVQDLTNVPEGYYTLSAEMLTQEGCVTDQHIFATNTSYNVDRNAESYDSPSLTFGGWSDEGNPVWTTLTTPVFYVGPDGLLTIGARGNHPAATDSLYNYTSEGWFLATNFRLNYYGMTEPQVPVVNEDNILYIADGLRFSKNKTNQLPVSLKNEDQIVGFQLDVVLPEGMTLAFDDEGEENITTTNRSKNHSITSNILSDGSIRLVGTNLSNKIISGTDGVLVNIGVEVADWLANGEYAIQLKNVKMTNENKQTLTCADKTFIVKIGGKMGDVNNDDAIDVTDAVLIIDEILMKNPANFDASLADVNNDGSIDVTDVVMVIDAILGKIQLARGVEASQKDLSAYTAFQMDLTIPAGYVLEGVELTKMAEKSHSLAYNMLADGRCRVVVFSMDNEALPGAWDEVIRLNLKGEGETFVNVDRAMFVTVGGERHELLLNGTTSIAQLSTLNSQFSIVYDLQGRKVEKSSKGLFIENGRKVVIK